MSRTLVIVLAFAGWALGPASEELTGTTSAAGRAVAGAVIWLDAPNAPRPAHVPPAVLTQRHVQFSPHVLAVQVGTKVKFPNDDRVFHNVFSYHEGKPFDLGLYPVGTVKDVPFHQPGLSRIFCNIHPQMAAYVMVVDTPYFAVSDDAGSFTIRGVPPGTYPYHAWRPGRSILNASIDVRAAAVLDVRWP